MMECEICGGYFHVDDIETCPGCGLELCPKCYATHVPICLEGDDWLEEELEEEREQSTIPHICPQCGEELELDLDMDGSAKGVYCPNSACGFREDFDEEQVAELQCDEEDEEEEEDALEE